MSQKLLWILTSRLGLCIFCYLWIEIRTTSESYEEKSSEGLLIFLNFLITIETRPSEDECSTGDKTIILGLQIFLDHRSSRTIDQSCDDLPPSPLPCRAPHPLCSSEFIGNWYKQFLQSLFDYSINHSSDSPHRHCVIPSFCLFIILSPCLLSFCLSV